MEYPVYSQTYNVKLNLRNVDYEFICEANETIFEAGFKFVLRIPSLIISEPLRMKLVRLLCPDLSGMPME